MNVERTKDERVLRQPNQWRKPFTDEEFLAYIAQQCVADGDCIRWQGHKNTKGYGEVTRRGKRMAVHRWVYAIKIGPIPPGMLVCHSCDVRDCCFEGHLFLGTEADNNRDAGNKGRHHNSVKTHCPRGHEYSFENTKLKVTATTVMRECKECVRLRLRSPRYREQAKLRYLRKKAKRQAQRGVA